MTCLTQSLAWPAPGRKLTLDPDCLHLWKCRLVADPQRMASHRRVLSPEELARAGRYTLAGRRNAFMAARGTLRRVLGRYLNREPSDVRFEYGPWGKPSLARPDSESGLCFNLSRSHDLMLMALTRGHEVGVDLEHTGRDRPVLELAIRFFAPGDAKALEDLPDGERTRAFYRLWTSKEARLKAAGTGLGLLDRNDSIDDSRTERFNVQFIDLGEGLCAAVAFEPKNLHLALGELP